MKCQLLIACALYIQVASSAVSNEEVISAVKKTISPCDSPSCGPNTQCIYRNGTASCVCLPNTFGDPYDGCQPECSLNLDCPSNKACLRNKCLDPCPGTCGINAECQVTNHSPNCSCIEGYTGDPFVSCHLVVGRNASIAPSNPCEPSPCGPGSVCRVVGDSLACSCLPGYVGIPPNCRPECTVSSECSQTSACINQTCLNPCLNVCAINTDCQVINHSPVCSCKVSYTGDPYTKCYLSPSMEPSQTEELDACNPSPCGPNSKCEDINHSPACFCLPNYIGRPPRCRPECTTDSECSNDLACVKTICDDPCPGACGLATECRAIKHLPKCTCFEGYSGDPYSYCQPKLSYEGLIKVGPCNPSPCGPNADCDDGICTCKPGYKGDDAYSECRPECVLNSDCPKNRACGDNKCIDPCVGKCGTNTECAVVDHVVLCACKSGYIGNALVECTRILTDGPKIPQRETQVNPCEPIPCGPNSQCLNINTQAVCSCISGFIGSPPACRPECVADSDCSLDKACINKKCMDPCEGGCGENAACDVSRHMPTCSCPMNRVGNPFINCTLKVQNDTVLPSNVCEPSPCGPNSTCNVKENIPSCSCLPNFIGSPPNCRLECMKSTECANEFTCINNTCKNPCPEACGQNAECRVVSHAPVCVCQPDYTGDPFDVCEKLDPASLMQTIKPCITSPCGVNAQCTEQNGTAVCECLNGFFGDPYKRCKPECVLNYDCPTDKYCSNSKCLNPCPKSCGVNAYCTVRNHVPDCNCIKGFIGNPFLECVDRSTVIIDNTCSANSCSQGCGKLAECNVINNDPCTVMCTCPPGYTGDAFVACKKLGKPVVRKPGKPCDPPPCGGNTYCTERHGTAICECLEKYVGDPYKACKPKCTCSGNQECTNRECINICLDVCGDNAYCEVIGDNPACGCKDGYTGDPISGCYLI